jgi:hypothetical protein
MKKVNYKALFLCFCTVSSLTCSALGLGEVPAIRLTEYNKLNFPNNLTKIKITSIIDKMIASLYGVAFVDIGELSDLMHFHVIHKYQKKDSPSFTTDDANFKSSRKDWSSFTRTGVLIHSQEYSFLRPNGEYIYRGDKLSVENRNWFYDETSSTFINAKKISINDSSKRNTIKAEDLPKRIVGNVETMRSMSVYFFKFPCVKIDELNLTPEAIISSNIIISRIEGVKVCLALSNSICRNYPDRGRCNSGSALNTSD